MLHMGPLTPCSRPLSRGHFSNLWRLFSRNCWNVTCLHLNSISLICRRTSSVHRSALLKPFPFLSCPHRADSSDLSSLQLCGVTAPPPSVRRPAPGARPMEPAWPPLPSSAARCSTSASASRATSWCPPVSRSTAAVQRACSTSTVATPTTATALTSRYPQVSPHGDGG